MKILSTFWSKGKNYGTYKSDSGEFETVLLKLSEKKIKSEMVKARFQLLGRNKK